MIVPVTAAYTAEPSSGTAFLKFLVPKSYAFGSQLIRFAALT